MYNNGFPVSYPQMFAQNFLQQPQPQGMTPPTIHADIVQVGSEQEADGYPVAAGASQMMMARDDSAIYVKSVLANGQSTLEVFEKRSQAQQRAQYVTREELEEMLAGLKPEKEEKK